MASLSHLGRRAVAGRCVSVRELARKIGLFDATMIVIGGIVGAGIFMNPHVVAARAGSSRLVLIAWAIGGLIALAGAFVYAELAARRPQAGGQYAYLREAHHELLAFLYGWALLLVIQTGGMAAVAITFAHYALELTHAPLHPALVASIALASLTAINCIGVRTGTTVQSVLTVLKIGAIIGLVACGLFLVPRAEPTPSIVSTNPSIGSVLAPVIFAYGGWQTSCFVAAEMRAPRRDLPRALLAGVTAVIVLYLAVNFICLRALGIDGLAKIATPASAVMRRAFGDRGGTLIALGIAISTLGFLSQSILTAPRVYFAMAEDGLFFRAVAWVHPRTRVPVVAIVLQGVCAIAIALSGRYEQILDFMVPVEASFYALTGTCLFVLRKRDRDVAEVGFRMPAQRAITTFFALAFALLAISMVIANPRRALLGFGIVLAGVPVYLLWRRRSSA